MMASALALIAYAILLALALVASAILGSRFRPEGRRRTIEDPDMLALLAGGTDRLVDSVLTRLLSRNALEVVKRGKLHVLANAIGNDPRERRVLGLKSEFSWTTARSQLRDDCSILTRQLTEQGQIVDLQAQRRIRRVQAAPLLALAGVAALVCLASFGTALPFAWIVAIGFTLLAALVRYSGIDARTQSGRNVVEAARDRQSRLAKAPTPDEYVLAVALFGTTVLAGTALDDFHKLRAPSDSGGGDSGGSDSSDSGCSGGGCGGGGCGS